MLRANIESLLPLANRATTSDNWNCPSALEAWTASTLECSRIRLFLSKVELPAWGSAEARNSFCTRLLTPASPPLARATAMALTSG